MRAACSSGKGTAICLGHGGAAPDGKRGQSAMEYLMTYGWAILIIAVVLGALYSLGVFNAVNFMPKVPGGGCHVFRPNGPGTSWNVNIVGSCNNALPQYVAQFNGKNTSAASYITSSATGFPIGNDPSSGFAWIYPKFTGGTYIIYSYGNPSAAGRVIELSIYRNKLIFWNGVTTYASPPVSISPDTWSLVGWTYTGGNTITVYKDGVGTAYTILQMNVTLPIANQSIIGDRGDGTGKVYTTGTFNGSIANVQIYNTSLTANQVAYLYNEGIGGVPISPQYLVGWWPLNGDTNDYSGNNNNGVPTNVIFNGTWTGGYNVP